MTDDRPHRRAWSLDINLTVSSSLSLVLISPGRLNTKMFLQGMSWYPLVIDDLVSTSPWIARGLKIHGKAEITETDGRTFLIIHPQRSWSWGVEDDAFKDGQAGQPQGKTLRFITINR